MSDYNRNDPLSPEARRVADAFWRACLGKEQSFVNDRKALAAALCALAEVAGAEYDGARQIDYAVDVEEIYRIADEIGGIDNG